MPALYYPPPIKRFRRAQVLDLGEFLVQQDGTTIITPVGTLGELLLTPDGVTQQDGFRYTADGFSQITRELAYGLGPLTADLSGECLRPGIEPDMIDPAVAISFFNTILSLRFERLRGRRVVKDMQTKLIEGVVGPKHRFLPNQTLFQQVMDTVPLSPTPTSFFAGQVIGRRLNLWFRSQQPVFRRTIDEQVQEFYSGFYFCNGETSGVSLRAANTVYNCFGCCLGSFGNRGGRLWHVGRGFLQRASNLFRQIVERDPDLQKCEEGLDLLLQSSLQISGAGEERVRQEQRIVSLLTRRSVKPAVAADIVHNALCVGHDVQPRATQEMEDISGHLAATRNGYDLLCALVRQARKLGTDRREKVEQVAYELLLGKLRI